MYLGRWRNQKQIGFQANEQASGKQPDVKCCSCEVNAIQFAWKFSKFTCFNQGRRC